MRMSQLFSQTLREVPAGVEVASHQLLVRAGFIRQLAAGVFSYLPLARRSLARIETILREEMNAIGGQELLMPVVHPADLWKESGRWFEVGAELGRFQDRAGRDLVLAMTHEEVVADLVRTEVRSYRHLPRLLYHIQTKWRDDPRPRAGLIRAREFTMKDSYSLDADWDGLDQQYQAHYQAYGRIFARCGLPVVAVQGDVGIMGGTLSHEFIYLTPIGEDTLLKCATCGYAANQQAARVGKVPGGDEALRPIEKIPTPGVTTIEQLATFLGVPASRLAKTLALVATIPERGRERHDLVLVVVRGDMAVNETKVANALQATALRTATEAEMRAVGLVPGYASPLGITGTTTIVDELIPPSRNLIMGANEAGYHLRNANFGRDLRADVVADIVAAEEGSPCPQCGAAMTALRGVEVGHIFKLGTRYSESMGGTFLDREGTWKPIVMGSYGIGTGRLLACIAEEHRDRAGLCWPVTVAPFQVHLVTLAGGSDRLTEVASSLYVNLQGKGVDILYDDRDESAGVKFMDADLIGLPLRLTVSQRSVDQGGAELKLRTSPDSTIVPLSETITRVQTVLADLAGVH